MSDQRADPEPLAYPAPNFPCVFADNISNFAYGQSLVRLYLVRNDPSFSEGTAEAKTQPIAQLVMPLGGFIATALFFERILSALVKEGAVTEDQIETLRTSVPQR